MIAIVLPDEAATAALAARVALMAEPRDVIALTGDLGAGKTAFARAFIRTCSGDANLTVPSPTFTLVQIYELATPVWHFDFYRLRDPAEIWELGIEEAFADGISLIEWPELAVGSLPADRTLAIALSAGDAPDARRAAISGGAGWTSRIATLSAEQPR